VTRGCWLLVTLTHQYSGVEATERVNVTTISIITHSLTVSNLGLLVPVITSNVFCLLQTEPLHHSCLNTPSFNGRQSGTTWVSWYQNLKPLQQEMIWRKIPFSVLTMLVGLHEGHPACKKSWCWFVCGDYLTGALQVLLLSLPLPSLLS